MAFPKTEAELVAAGYVAPKKSSVCKGYGAEIEWWKTPKHKSIPLDAGTLEPHWDTCPNAKDFRDRKAAEA